MKYVEIEVTRTQSTIIVVGVPDDFDLKMAWQLPIKPLIQTAVDAAEPWYDNGTLNGAFEIESAGDACAAQSECQFNPATDKADVTLTSDQINEAFKDHAMAVS